MDKTMTQMKFTVESGIAAAFKARCVSEGVSMASVISQFMKTGKPARTVNVRTDTRPHRKEAVSAYIGFLEDVMDKESQYRDAIPEQFTSRMETADYTCERLSEAISSLQEAY